MSNKMFDLLALNKNKFKSNSFNFINSIFENYLDFLISIFKRESYIVGDKLYIQEDTYKSRYLHFFNPTASASNIDYDEDLIKSFNLLCMLDIYESFFEFILSEKGEILIQEFTKGKKNPFLNTNNLYDLESDFNKFREQITMYFNDRYSFKFISGVTRYYNPPKNDPYNFKSL